MKRVSLNFAQAPRHRFTLTAAVASVLIASLVLARQHAAEVELQEWQREWHTLTERSAPQASKSDSYKKLGQEIAHANRVIDKLSIPWGDVVGAIDTTIVDDVTLLSVEPDVERRQIRIVAEARNRTAMLNYMRALQRSAIFRDGHVVSDQFNLQDLQRPVRFSALARWARDTRADAGTRTESAHY